MVGRRVPLIPIWTATCSGDQLAINAPAYRSRIELGVKKTEREAQPPVPSIRHAGSEVFCASNPTMQDVI